MKMKNKWLVLLALPVVLGAALWPVARNVRQNQLNAALINETMQAQPNMTQVRLLIAQGAQVNGRSRDSYGLTPLHQALNADTCEFLIDNGADVNAQDQEMRQTPLMFAAWHGNVPVVRVLLAHGAKLNIKDADGRTALSFMRAFKNSANQPCPNSSTAVCYHDYAQVVQLLKAAGAKP